MQQCIKSPESVQFSVFGFLYLANCQDFKKMDPRQRKRIKNAKANEDIDNQDFKHKNVTFVTLAIITAILAIFVTLFWSSADNLIPNLENNCVLQKEAKSALNRAKSPKCKESLKKVACQPQNELYPPRFESLCDFYQNLPYLGCFQDSFQNRILQNGSVKVNLKLTNSPEECARYCYERKFPFAGVQFGRECFCGDTVDPSHKIDEDKCDNACPGNDGKKCGGYLAMNIYKTKFQNPKVLKEESVRIAYLFIVHGRSLRQVYRLLQKLYNPEDFFYFHVDSRSEYMYGHLKDLENKGLDNIKVADDRFATIWGGASLLQMMIASMQEMLKLKWNMDFVINLSESDYLLKHPQNLKKFLALQKGMNFVKSHGRDTDTFIKKQGLDRTFYECDHHMYRLGSRTLPSGIIYDGGSDWFCLSKSFIQYILQEKDALLNGLFALYNYTLLPAESFFHIVLKNSRFCSTYNNNNLRSTNWRRAIGCQCQHKNVVDWCGCSPNVFKLQDWEKILKTQKRDQFFARKFDATIDMSVMNAIDGLIFGLYSDEQSSKFWLNIWHQKYDLDNTIFKFASQLLTEEKSQVELKEVTILYEYDNLKSLLVLYNNGVVEKESQYAIKQLQQTSSGDVISVGSNFDVKERIFRQSFPIFDDDANPSFLIQPQFDTKEEFHSGSVLWLSPSGKVVFADRDFQINITTNYHVVHFPHSEKKLNFGLWTIIYFDFMQKVNSVYFLVMNSDDATKIEETQVPLLQQEIGLINSIHAKKPDEKTWLTSYFSLEETCIVNQTCHGTTWSSKSPDSLSSIEL